MICVTTMLLVCGCIDISLPGQLTFLGSGSIVLRGRMSDSADSACPLWVADNGLQFVLFQNARVANADFDEILIPGTTSRLELRGRPDLGDACLPGAENAEVMQVLEVNGEDVTKVKLDELRSHVKDLVDTVRMRLSERGDEITQELRDRIDNIEAQLEAKKNELQETVDDIYESIRDRLQDSETVRTRLNEFVNEVKWRIDEAVDRLEASKEDFIDDLRDGIAGFIENLRDSIDSPLQDLEERIAAFVERIEDLKSRLSDAANEIRDRIDNELEQKRQEVIARLEELHQEFEESLQGWLDDVRDRLTADMPNPDLDIPPVLEDLLPGIDDLDAWLREHAQERIGQILDDLGILIDQENADTAVAFGGAFADFLADAAAPDTVDSLGDAP
jgi:predicted  nucleic acid-binding Zn-ribbon protein